MQNEKKYPFKLLNAYERSDKDFYFGRKEEVEQLYEMTFQSNLLLVYGASGTGKTSLIQCGLANCFETHDWLDIPIRRGININKSLKKALKDKIGNETDFIDDELDTDDKTDRLLLARQIKTLRLKYFKPIYLIFDQFEELYIFGNEEEQTEFYKNIKQLLSLNQPVKIIITIREEYLGHLYYFERIVPDILRKKLRIEPMTLDKVSKVMHGINNSEKSLVTWQKGKKEREQEEIFIQAIYDKLHESKISIELPYLQALLEKMYRDKTHDYKPQPTTSTTLGLDDLSKIGNIGDILFDLLNGLISQIIVKETVLIPFSQTGAIPQFETNKNIAPETVWEIFSCLVTAEGTKEPLSVSKLQKQVSEIDKNTLDEILKFFVSKYILRFDKNENLYEIVHDSLAKQIHDNLSEEKKGRKKAKKLIENKRSLDELLSEEQLIQIDLYLNQSEQKKLSLEEIDCITRSRQEIEGKKKKKKKELNYLIVYVATHFVASLVINSIQNLVGSSWEFSNWRYIVEMFWFLQNIIFIIPVLLLKNKIQNKIIKIIVLVVMIGLIVWWIYNNNVRFIIDMCSL